MDPERNVSRRRFIGTGILGACLLAVGGAVGWMASRMGLSTPRKRRVRRKLDKSFLYDIEKYVKTDPRLVLYEPTGRIDTGFRRARRIALSTDDRVYVAGDKAVRVFGVDGQREGEIPLPDRPLCLFVDAADRIFIGMRDHVEVYTPDGKVQATWESLGRRAYLTAIAVAGDVFVADAGSREVLRYGVTGKLLGRFGKKDKTKGTPGFVVPSPYFDLAAGPDGLLHVANPGRHRIETYGLDGRFNSAWGKPSLAIEGFCGCCNPVYFAVHPGGGFVTSEKGLTRIKVYSSEGQFRGVVAGPEQLGLDKELLERACLDCSIGAGHDVAVNSRGQVLALDPKTRIVQVFSMIAGRDAPEGTT